MRRSSVPSMIAAGAIAFWIASCGILLYSLSGIYRTKQADDLTVYVRSCTDSAYHVQYCLGLVPTVPAMYPSLYHSEDSP